MSNRVFISYSGLDYRDGTTEQVIPGNAVARVMEAFNRNGIDYWIAEKGIVAGKGWPEQIPPAIDYCDIFLFISSANSNASENTANEVQYALNGNKRIIPLRIDRSDYHEGVRINLVRTHFLKYYNDPDKALESLVQAIKSGEEIREESVTLLPEDASALTGGSIAGGVLSIFNSASFQESTQRLSDLVEAANCTKEKGYDRLLEFITGIRRAAEERNHIVRNAQLANLIAKIKGDNTTMNRRVSVLKTLVLMFLYYSIGDSQEAQRLQKGLGAIEFQRNFVERNAQTINDVTNGMTRGALLIAGVVGMLTGRGGSLSRSMTMTSTRGEKIKVVSSPEEIDRNETVFKELKDAVARLHFDA